MQILISTLIKYRYFPRIDEHISIYHKLGTHGVVKNIKDSRIFKFFTLFVSYTTHSLYERNRRNVRTVYYSNSYTTEAVKKQNAAVIDCIIVMLVLCFECGDLFWLFTFFLISIKWFMYSYSFKNIIQYITKIIGNKFSIY